MLALGIDPGTRKTGWGCVRRDGARLVRVDSGTIRTDERQPMEKRLLTIHDELTRILTSLGPDGAAVEDIFFAKNAQSALKLGQARGVILMVLARAGLAIASYPPALVKRSIVGGGRADKNQMQHVVAAILGLTKIPEEDEADALAIAVCHLNASRINAPQPRR